MNGPWPGADTPGHIATDTHYRKDTPVTTRQSTAALVALVATFTAGCTDMADMPSPTTETRPATAPTPVEVPVTYTSGGDRR